MMLMDFDIFDVILIKNKDDRDKVYKYLDRYGKQFILNIRNSDMTEEQQEILLNGFKKILFDLSTINFKKPEGLRKMLMTLVDWRYLILKEYNSELPKKDKGDNNGE